MVDMDPYVECNLGFCHENGLGSVVNPDDSHDDYNDLDNEYCLIRQEYY